MAANLGLEWQSLQGTHRLLVGTTSDNEVFTATSAGELISGPIELTDRNIGCGLTVANDQDGGSAVYAITNTTTPAAGLDPEKVTFSLTRYDLNLANPASLELVTGEPSLGQGCGDWTLGTTQDGNWLTVNLSADGDNIAGYVDLRTFELTRTKDVPVPVGNFLSFHNGFCANCQDEGLQPAVVLLDPATGSKRTFAKKPLNVRELLRDHSMDPDSFKQMSTDQLIATSYENVPTDLGYTSKPVLMTLDLAAGTARRVAYFNQETNSSAVFDPLTGVALVAGDEAFAVSDGSKLWDLGGWHRMCAAGNGVAVVVANGQLSSVDLATGKQAAYTAQLESCPDFMLDDWGWYHDGTLVRILPAR